MILVTGAAGYIGSQIVHTLNRTFDHPAMVGVDNLSRGVTCPLPADFECFHGDAGARRFMGNLITRYKVDKIIHCAASISVPESVKDPLKYYHNNTAATLALIEVARDCRVQKFVFSSTAAVYGEPEFRTRVREDDPCRPMSPYGSSKLMAEQVLMDSGVPHVILRYFNVAGTDPLGLTGPRPARGGQHLIARACDAVLGGPKLVVYGSGNAQRDYVHVADVASAHLQALLHPEDGTFNVGWGAGVSIHEVVNEVEIVSGKHVPREKGNERAGDPMFLVANTNKIKDQMGWSPRYTLRNMVEDTLRWQKGQ